MSYRDPVTVYVSYFYAFKDVSGLTNAQKVAHTLVAIMRFKQSMDSDTLAPDMAKTPLCTNAC
jgi:carnitine O-acetyltransferase